MFKLLVVALSSLQSLAWGLAEHGTPDQHEIHVVTYKQGVFAPNSQKIFDRASSPDALFLQQKVGAFEKGSVLLFFTDFQNWDGRPRTEYLSVSSSRNGLDFGPRQKINITPEEIGRQATDASVIQMNDGKIRIFFMTPGRQRGQVQIKSALSVDGINYTIEETDLMAAGNPEVFTHNQHCFMFLSRYQDRSSDLAISNDCLHWRMVPDASIQAAGIGVLQDSGLTSNSIKYFAEFQGLSEFSFNPSHNKGEGVTSSRPLINPGAISADPSPIEMSDGSILIYFKYQKMNQ